jgi:hypothetical protein
LVAADPAHARLERLAGPLRVVAQAGGKFLFTNR